MKRLPFLLTLFVMLLAPAAFANSIKSALPVACGSCITRSINRWCISTWTGSSGRCGDLK
jgi:hypothetical protein